MQIFALDTSGPTAGVAIYKDGEIRYEAVVKNKMTHSETVMPLTEEAFLHADLSLSDTDYFAVVTGPGSFTGVRIGVTAVKAMAHAENKSIIEIDALQAFAGAVSLFDGILSPIQDARAGQVYGAAFEGLTMKRLMDDQPIALHEYIEQIRKIACGRKMLLVGDGAAVNRSKIEAYGEKDIFFAPEDLNYLSPAYVARLAAEKTDEAKDYMSVKPLYLRPPKAERQKNLLELYGHE